MKHHKTNTRRNILRTAIFLTAVLFAAPAAMARTGPVLYPIALAISDDGSVFVADYGNNRIQKWQPGK